MISSESRLVNFNILGFFFASAAHRAFVLPFSFCIPAQHHEDNAYTQESCVSEHGDVNFALNPAGGGDQHRAPRPAEAAVSQNQNGGREHDPGRSHPPHPQRRVHGVSVPQHRRGRLSACLPPPFLHTKTNSAMYTLTRPRRRLLCFSFAFISFFHSVSVALSIEK